MTLSPAQIDFIKQQNTNNLPNFSIDCAVFGFHKNQLKILLNKLKGSDSWGLPGGFIKREESMDDAAKRILLQRTGLENIFLKQFMTFGAADRNTIDESKKLILGLGLDLKDFGWFMQRMISVGYYALVDFSKASPEPDVLSEASEWWDVATLPSFIFDHKSIVENALQSLRLNLVNQPVGYKLLPEKFTMTELRSLYETILGKSIDRRNFEKKMLKQGILDRLNEQKRGVGYKSPFLYQFNSVRYHQLLDAPVEFGF